MVVEGVEDAEALAALRAWGCDVAQGYHIGRPMPADRFLAWLEGRPSPVPPADRQPG
jgi:EAL domain-containing protein (putative c-di-GMP-specific phosphodiesterase class I)